MITIMMLVVILPIIMIGAIVAVYFAIDHEQRRLDHEQELRDIDVWLEAMWKA